MSITVFYDGHHSGHRPPASHPERPERVETCMTWLSAEPGSELSVKEAPAADMQKLQLVHDPAYLDSLKTDLPRMIDLDTYLAPASFDVASRAAGAVCEGVSQTGKSFALVRPPGHHAGVRNAMGFCLINSVAVGAAFALNSGLAAKVAIVDLDVHHGNGTQEIFWENENVLYVSLHQYPWYPWDSGALGETGAGAGAGTTVNIPLPAMTGDDVYLSAVSRIVVPVLEEYRPDLLLVSAGFDAHSDDPLSMQEVSTEGFATMMMTLTRAADRICDGRLVAVLEGGYHLDALAECVVASVRAFAGGGPPIDAASLSEGLPFGAHGLSKVIQFHSRQWNL